MSRCAACNKILSEYEQSIKGAESNEYLDMCLDCLKTTDITCLGDLGLLSEAEYMEEDDE